MNIHLHCLVLDGVYRNSECVPVFHEVATPTIEELQALLAKIITRIMPAMLMAISNIVTARNAVAI